MSRRPNLGVTIFLYIAGILLVLFAVLLLLQSLGVLSNIPQSVLVSILLLGIGAGILAGINRQT